MLFLAPSCALVPHGSPGPAVLPPAGPWIRSLGEHPCAGPFRGHLRLRIQAAQGRPLGLDGALSAAPPETLRLSARVGPFRPVLALLAGADSCELLLHDQAAYWITPRGRPDWERMDPSAWATALGWALAPSRLLAAFRPETELAFSAGLAWCEGTLAGTGQEGGEPLHLRAGLEPGTGRLKEFRVRAAGADLVVGTLDRYRKVAGGEVPTSLQVDMPGLKWGLHAELRDMVALRDRVSLREGFPRPPGWRRASSLEPSGLSGETGGGTGN
jgi:hypothetical protein